MPSDGLGDRYRLDVRLVMQFLVKTAQELASRLMVILPRILAIQDHGYNGIPSLLEHRPSGFADVVHQVARGIGGRHSGIDKTDQVGDGVVAEDQVHRGVTLFETMHRVKLLCLIDRKTTGAIAGKLLAETPSENSLLGGHPPDAQTLRDC